MAYFEIIWDEEPGGNVEHVAEHGLTPEDVEEVIFNPVDHDVSRSRCQSIVGPADRLWLHTRRALYLGCV
jgi:hypothetical protein